MTTIRCERLGRNRVGIVHFAERNRVQTFMNQRVTLESPRLTVRSALIDCKPLSNLLIYRGLQCAVRAIPTGVFCGYAETSSRGSNPSDRMPPSAPAPGAGIASPALRCDGRGKSAGNQDQCFSEQSRQRPGDAHDAPIEARTLTCDHALPVGRSSGNCAAPLRPLPIPVGVVSPGWQS